MEETAFKGGRRVWIGDCALAHRLFNFRDPIRPLQHFAWLRPVGGAYNAIAFHEVDEVGGASVADAQAALQEGSGGFAELDHEANGIVVERIVVFGGNFSRIVAVRGHALAIFFRRLQEFLLILRLPLRPPEFHDGGDFLFGYIRSVQAIDARGAGGPVGRVAAAYKPFSPAAVETVAPVAFACQRDRSA